MFYIFFHQFLYKFSKTEIANIMNNHDDMTWINSKKGKMFTLWKLWLYSMNDHFHASFLWSKSTFLFHNWSLIVNPWVCQQKHCFIG